MAERYSGLKFLTSQRSDSTRDAKVFCGFHPANQKIAEEIMGDLLSVCNGTVFYYDKGEFFDEGTGFENDLSQMALLVLVVSSDYLSSTSFARERLYTYAIEHMIPVLPIVTEPGLETLFENAFGNMQYILWHGEQHDITAIPYLERLKNHLSQVLCTDKSRKEFRDAFDTGVFLSYRKKDRYYAQKLMEMIHMDERCRGISIWYDEFLIPGEDFNQNISKELENSSMMLLVVTPHLTEKNNYIVLTEYPAALEMEKTVLPFEMCPTSQKELETMYRELPAVHSGTEACEVQQAILSAIKKLGIPLTEGSAQKEYLRGLAYLKGICVEKNQTIGCQKITQAAGQGVPQAMQTLSFMYKNGEGVVSSVEEALFWQKQYLETVLQAYKESRTALNAQGLVEIYFELGALYELDSKPNEAIAVYEKIQSLCGEKPFQNSDSFTDFCVSAKIKAGTLYLSLSDYVNARYRCFESAVNSRKQQLEQEFSMDRKLSLCQLYALISQCCENCQDRPGAKSYGILLRNELASLEDEIPPTGNYFSLLSRLALCKSQLAHLYVTFFEDKSHEAFLFVGEAIEIAEKLVSVSRCYSSQRQLVLAHINNGDQHITQNQSNHYHAAQQAYGEAYQCLSEMITTYGMGFELQQISARLMQKQGLVKQGLGEIAAAQALYGGAVEQFRLLHLRQDTIITRKDLYHCLKEASVVYEKNGSSETVREQMLTEAAELARQNREASPLAVYKKDEATIRDLLSTLYKNQWDMDNAFLQTQQQVNLLREVAAGTGRVGDLRLFVGALVKAVKTANLAGEFQTGTQWQREARDLYGQYQIYFENAINL